ncbi:hypothetical protein TRFO_23748 [Tritrichomonas foetus]|uniref:Uncharacterized protein n=1 Tax=Tritrichomonas foetus TaxID=1144522 RepID=A0A1J4K9H8_9EUKA|nr:hypothetical protein TRFO_23748 [Tritrichomonas foetus]|eukprot:OHT07883.1 hypothetical protein TRFO_23748 [Tritrichomonas foetus]
MSLFLFLNVYCYQKMIDLAILEEIRPSTDQFANELILDKEISNEFYSLQGLKTEENRLKMTLQKEQKNLQKSKNDHKILKTDLKHLKNDENYNPNRGGFFTRLRSYEAEYERITSQIDGLKSTIIMLNDQIKAARLKNKKLSQKVEDSNDKLANENERTNHFVTLLNDLNESHQQLTVDVEELGNECELIKARIKRKAAELRKFTPNDAAIINMQKKTLQNDLKEKQDYLTDLKFQEKKQKSKNLVSTKLRNKDIKSRSSTTNWMSERMSYIAKIKKAKEEIRHLQQFERSNKRLTEITEKQKDELSFTEEELKNTILAEIKSKEFHKSQFYEETVETELEYREELMEQLAEIDQSMDQIAKFRVSTIDLLRRQEEVATMGDRLDILKDELTDIRSDLM